MNDPVSEILASKKKRRRKTWAAMTPAHRKAALTNRSKRIKITLPKVQRGQEEK